MRKKHNSWLRQQEDNKHLKGTLNMENISSFKLIEIKRVKSPPVRVNEESSSRPGSSCRPGSSFRPGRKSSAKNFDDETVRSNTKSQERYMTPL